MIVNNPNSGTEITLVIARVSPSKGERRFHTTNALASPSAHEAGVSSCHRPKGVKSHAIRPQRRIHSDEASFGVT